MSLPIPAQRLKSAREIGAVYMEWVSFVILMSCQLRRVTSQKKKSLFFCMFAIYQSAWGVGEVGGRLLFTMV